MQAKNSQTHPIKVDFIRSNEFPVLDRLGMTFAPGKKQSDALSGSWDRDLRADLDRLFDEFGTGTLISLLEDVELEELEIIDLAAECERVMLNLVRFPIRDGAVPNSVEDFVVMVAGAVDFLKQGETVVTHCKGGLGRAGTAAACIAIAVTDAEITASEAIDLVRHARPGTIENEAQEQFVEEFEKEWHEVIEARGDHYLLYWQERSVEEHAANEMPLDVVASNQLTNVLPGDVIWIVTLTQERELVLAGRLSVGEVVEYEEAIRRMPDAGLWQAEYYAFPEPETEEYLRQIDIHHLAADLRFESDDDRFLLRDGKINPRQLQSIRKLTRQSVDMFEDAFYTIGPFAADELEPEAMLDIARQVVEMMPDDADAQYNLGVALGRNEMYEDEVSAYEKTLQLDPNYFGAQYNLGNVLIRLGRYEEAIEALNKVILISDEFAPAHFMLGVAYFEAGRPDDAIAATQQGLEFDPNDEGAYYNIAYWTFIQGDYQGALVRCDDVIARFPYYTGPHVLKGMCFRELGELDNEIQSYRDAVDIKVDNEGAFIINFTAVFFLGAAWEHKITGSDEGIEYIEADHYFNLDAPTHQFCMAMGHLAQGDREYADQWIEGLRTSAPELAGRLERAMLGCPHVVVFNDQPSILADSDSDAYPARSPKRARTAIHFAVGDKNFTAKNIPDLYQQVLQYLVLTQRLDEFDLPIASGPKRYLIARRPVHPAGQNFLAPVECQGFFMEAHNNRAAAIAQLKKLLDGIQIPNQVLENADPPSDASSEIRREQNAEPLAGEKKDEGSQEPAIASQGQTLVNELGEDYENRLVSADRAGESAKATSMKVVTLNMRQGGGNRILPILDYLQSLDADVFVLTEFRENVNAPILRSKLSEAGLLHFAAAPTASPMQNGVCIFSRYQFLPRIYSEFLAADTHRVISAHFGALSIYGVYFPQKMAKAPLFRFLLDGRYKPANTEVIVMGDFNTGLHRLDENGSSFFCADLFSLLPDAGLFDSWRSRNPEERVFSWYSNVGNGFRIDHVFSNPSADSKIERVYYDHTPRETGITDHSAMVVEYSENND